MTQTIHLKNLFLRIAILLSVFTATLAMAAEEFEPNLQPYGYQAPLALSKSNVRAGDALAFVPWFQDGEFKGDLLAAPVSSDGIVNYFGPVWRASVTLNAQNWNAGRRIVTRHEQTGVGTPFRFLTISDKQQDYIVDEPTLNYVRGDDSGETAAGFRIRTSNLGDIIHSNPVYVGKPRRGYLFDSYLSFAATNQARPGRVYVGANDGMLHAFNAESGTEEFAYIPSMLLPRLPELAETPFVHNYFVDGPLVAEDAFLSSSWHTMLVGGLGAGGMGLFALDVTSATVASEADAATRVKWEITDDDISNLGYTYSRPSIVRANNGQWVVITGNGYMSKDGKAALLVLDLATGALIREIVVDDSDKNGLSSPAAIDTNGDSIADVAYAGDLNGNLWKFDLSNSDPASWVAAWDKKPLFMTVSDAGTGERQSITTAPTVGVHPEGGYFVYVATGRLLAAADSEGDFAVAPDAIYGIWDNAPLADDLPYESVNLLQQSLLVKTHPDDPYSVYTATSNTPDWTVHRGWAMPLDAGGLVPGTRVLTNHSLRNGRIQFTSIDPTTGSGSNYLMQLNAYTGGAPTSTVIDVDGNGSIETADNVDGDGNGAVEDTAADRVAGQYLGIGTASEPFVARLGNNDAAIINQLYTVYAFDNPSPDAPPDGGGEDLGLIGGHIDVDTSHMIYDFDDGETDKHEHEWDDKHDATVIDFFEIAGDGFADIDEPAMQPKQGNQTFILTVANAHLSPGAIIEINGAAQPVKDYRAKIKRYLQGNLGPAETFPRYKLSTPSDAEALAGVVQLTDFRMSFAKDGLLLGGVHPTNTGCVKSNQPGQNGEYRNGALTIQALDAASVPAGHVFNPLNDAYETVSHAVHELGYAVSRVGSDDGSLFWETTVFWHWGGKCFGIDDAEEYNTQFAAEVTDVDRGTDDDISGEPPPEPDPEPEPDPDAETDAEPATSGVTTIEIAGGAAGRLSWRELMIDE